MLRIQRSGNGEVVFTLSGQMDEEPMAELETLISSEANGRPIIPNLRDLTLVDEKCYNLPSALRSKQHRPEEVPGIRARVDQCTTTRKLVTKTGPWRLTSNV
jgi:hypothetical protein